MKSQQLKHKYNDLKAGAVTQQSSKSNLVPNKEVLLFKGWGQLLIKQQSSVCTLAFLLPLTGLRRMQNRLSQTIGAQELASRGLSEKHFLLSLVNNWQHDYYWHSINSPSLFGKKNKVLICTISLKPATKTICHISVVAPVYFLY